MSVEESCYEDDEDGNSLREAKYFVGRLQLESKHMKKLSKDLIWFTLKKKLTTRAYDRILPQVDGETFSEMHTHWIDSKVGNNALEALLLFCWLISLKNAQSIQITI